MTETNLDIPNVLQILPTTEHAIELSPCKMATPRTLSLQTDRSLFTGNEMNIIQSSIPVACNDTGLEKKTTGDNL